jgi:hypothetical protein
VAVFWASDPFHPAVVLEEEGVGGNLVSRGSFVVPEVPLGDSVYGQGQALT